MSLVRFSARPETVFEDGIRWRRNRFPAISVRADIVDGSLAPDVADQLLPGIDAIRAELPPGYAIEVGAAGVKAELPPGQVHSFRDLMMPALVRVGAVTERSRALYAEAKIPVWEDASVLERLEHLGTGEIVFEA